MAKVARKVNPSDLRAFQELKAELNKWNVEYVAQSAPVGVSTIYNWLEGRTMYPRLDTLTKVARVVGFEIQLVRVAKPKKKAVLKVVK